MEWLIILLLLAILIVVPVFQFFFLHKNRRPEEDSQSMMLLLNQMEKLSGSVDKKLGEGTEIMFKGMGESQKLATDIRDLVTRQLTEIAREQTKTNEATTRFTVIAEQLGNLEKVLKHQKQRGNLGERSLQLVLENVLPPGTFKMQHEFKNKEIVDAVIITKQGLIPIDAKFSLDNYNRVVNEVDETRKVDLEKDFKNDLKLRIDETAKYVRPSEGTLPFAFMYIPAEAIYYDLLINEVGSVKVNTRNLIDYAYNEKKVIVVSPTTFYAYLQSVLYGLKAFQIEERTREIVKYVGQLTRHFKSYEDFHNRLGTSLKTTVNHYMASGKELGKLDKDVEKITEVPVGFELETVEKPALEEGN